MFDKRVKLPLRSEQRKCGGDNSFMLDQIDTALEHRVLNQ